MVSSLRRRRNARDDAEPGFRDNELNESKARLRGNDWSSDQHTEQLPSMPPPQAQPDPDPNSLWTHGRREQ
jgi:hypothetical protein